MKRVLLLGVGRSTHTLIKYLVNYSQRSNIQVRLADQCDNNFVKDYVSRGLCDFIHLDINHLESRQLEISNSNIVISMLPPRFHFLVAKECLKFKKHLITASYASEEMNKLDKEAKQANILILNEVGLDPGIDHISAMEVIDRLHEKGATISVFKSFCGGLVAPKYDNNPWNYKFTWNPKNVVLAGSSGASYLKDGRIKNFTYQQVFSNIEKIEIPNYGAFESYANRNSLQYQKKYNLIDAHTIVRGTLRKTGFSKAWDVFVQLGMTSDDSCKKIISSHKFSKYLKKLNDSDINKKMHYLDLFNKDNLSNYFNSPASFLLNILKNKWSLEDGDKDMIVMQHQFEYSLNNIKKRINFSMVTKGDNNIHTAMAKTVGLPVFFACKLLLEDSITLKGVKIPIHKEIYEPILKDLSNEGINFFTS